MRWLVLSFGLCVVMLHQFLEGIIRRSLFASWELIEVAYGILVSVSAWLIITWLRRSVGQANSAEQALNQTLVELNQANERLEFLLQVNHRLSQAEDDTALVDIIVDLFMSVAPAEVCSLIRFDAQQRTLPVVYRRQGDLLVVDNQMDHLSVDEVLQRCEICKQREPGGASACAVIELPPEDAAAYQKIHCLQLARGSELYGMLSLYLQDPAYPNDQEQQLLEMIANEITMALESHTLRSRELTMLNRLQQARRLSNLHEELATALTGTVEALEVAGGALFLTDNGTHDLQLQAEAGQPLEDNLDLVEGLASGASHAETPLVINDIGRDNGAKGLSLLIAPLRAEERALGSLVLWDTKHDVFTSRRTQLVATVAGQAALLIENHQLYLHGEHRAVLAERARLAREIHDGLAQTLGYLKLRISQINTRFKQGQDQQAMSSLDEVQQMLSEAYIDTREAIDGLSLTAQTSNLQAWIHEIVNEFEVLSGIPVTVGPVPDVSLTPEVHVQLQRIVQETFSNIRKHADATRAWLNWQQDDCSLTLQIRDNGCGFDLDDILLTGRHGLRIMRERAELLDADFQLAGQEDGGTQVTIRLPLNGHIGEVHNV